MSGSNITVGDSGFEFPEYCPNLRSFFVFTTGVTSHNFFSAPSLGGYAVQRVFIQVSTNATIAAAGQVTLSFQDSDDGEWARFVFFLPQTNANPTVPTVGPTFSTGANFIYMPNTKETDCSVTISPALTAGSVIISMNGITIPTFVPHP